MFLVGCLACESAEHYGKRDMKIGAEAMKNNIGWSLETQRPVSGESSVAAF
jgi:hypothetical protein